MTFVIFKALLVLVTVRGLNEDLLRGERLDAKVTVVEGLPYVHAKGDPMRATEKSILALIGALGMSSGGGSIQFGGDHIAPEDYNLALGKGFDVLLNMLEYSSRYSDAGRAWIHYIQEEEVVHQERVQKIEKEVVDLVLAIDAEESVESLQASGLQDKLWTSTAEMILARARCLASAKTALSADEASEEAGKIAQKILEDTAARKKIADDKAKEEAARAAAQKKATEEYEAQMARATEEMHQSMKEHANDRVNEMTPEEHAEMATAGPPAVSMSEWSVQDKMNFVRFQYVKYFPKPVETGPNKTTDDDLKRNSKFLAWMAKEFFGAGLEKLTRDPDLFYQVRARQVELVQFFIKFVGKGDTGGEVKRDAVAKLIIRLFKTKENWLDNSTKDRLSYSILKRKLIEQATPVIITTSGRRRVEAMRIRRFGEDSVTM